MIGFLISSSLKTGGQNKRLLSQVKIFECRQGLYIPRVIQSLVRKMSLFTGAVSSMTLRGLEPIQDGKIPSCILSEIIAQGEHYGRHYKKNPKYVLLHPSGGDFALWPTDRHFLQIQFHDTEPKPTGPRDVVCVYFQVVSSQLIDNSIFKYFFILQLMNIYRKADFPHWTCHGGPEVEIQIVEKGGLRPSKEFPEFLWRERVDGRFLFTKDAGLYWQQIV